MNNPKLNNSYHYLLMFALAYTIGYFCNVEEYTFDGRYIGFPIAITIGLGVFGGFIEWCQSMAMKVNFDRMDVARYAIGALSGGLLYAFFPSKAWIMYASGIPAVIACILTVAHYVKVKRNQ